MTLRQRPILIDGAHGEGGGQILRTALVLSAVTGRPLTIENVRAGRPKPGLAAQHLTGVRAVARLCQARVAGDALGSTRLEFAPTRAVAAGDYDFDVAEARLGGSAGATTLVIQSVVPPLALAAGRSCVSVHGGTHVPWSPSADYARDVWLPALATMGVEAEIEIVCFGWFPVGRGEVRAAVIGRDGRPLRPLDRRERGALRGIGGRAVAANLPAHIAERMAGRARAVLADAGLGSDIRAESMTAACPGAGIFLTAIYEHGCAGFAAIGERGKPSEVVAGEAVADLLAFHRAGAAVDAHLGDQLILPAALADGISTYSVERVTRHLTTNAWVVERFGLAHIAIDGGEGRPGVVTVTPVRPGS
jgi:RNA 3'-terminal phosphate cyclase (ATP)